MAPLLTTAQARWVLHAAVALLCVAAIASSAPASAGGTPMLSGGPGDIRGLVVLVASAALSGGLVLLCLPRPWQLYVDRLEFSFVAMLWIMWTSATLAFSAFTLEKGICNRTLSDVYLPTCALLTADLVLLHLLSTASLALALAVLSAALQPGYRAGLSVLSPAAPGGGDAHDDVLVMWDMAIASAPTTPVVESVKGFTSYGATGSTAPAPASVGGGAQGRDRSMAAAAGPNPALAAARDKFAAGRPAAYAALCACSFVVLGTSAGAMDGTHLGTSLFLVLVALCSVLFSVLFLVLHFTRRGKAAGDDGVVRRYERALELALAGSLFMLWPLAAIVYTISPPTANQPCLNPSASAAPLAPDATPPADADGAPPAPGYTPSACALTCLAVGASWAAAAVVLARLAGAVAPRPLARRPDAAPAGRQGAAAPLLAGPRYVDEPAREDAAGAGLGYGRLVAGEAFELGDDDE